ncbi:MAG: ABC transporter ATP-binding protein [Desulfatibacillaceae bacterium]|nr:ABC transporter ATP-binding protein [Desulfatibacillaceae bacterium]
MAISSRKFFSLPEIKPRHRHIFARIKENRWRLLLAMLGSFMMAVTNVSIAYFIKDVVDDIFVLQDRRMLALMPVVTIILFSVRGVGYYTQEYFMHFAGQRIIKNLRDTLYDKLMDLPLSFFQGERTGALMSRITWDVNLVRDMVSRAVTSSMRDFFSILGLIGLIFYLDWRLAFYAIVVLPLAYFPVVFFGRLVRKVSTRSQEAMEQVSAFLQETFSGSKIVRAFGMEDREKERFFAKTQGYFKLEIKAAIAKSASSPIMEFLAGLGIAFVIWYGGSAVIEGAKTPGELMSFLAAVLMLYDPVKKLTYLNNSLQEGMAATDRIFDLIERENPIKEAASPKALEHRPHTVEFESVSFAYDNDTLVLKDISFAVDPGQVIALVGMSGGGKTSLVNLVPRFFDVTGGALKIDGIDIRELSIENLRSQIAIVTQEPILFNDTVAANIAYGKPDATDQQVVAAAKAAYAHDFVTSFEKGYNSVIGELGGRISGGEKQRLCIARALLKDAPILILDEATSSLDTQAERLVQKALENLMEGRTCFVIAHRLSTVRHADRILVISGGSIVEQGTHDCLMNNCGEYSRLHALQFALDGDEAPGGKTETGP